MRPDGGATAERRCCWAVVKRAGAEIAVQKRTILHVFAPKQGRSSTLQRTHFTPQSLLGSPIHDGGGTAIGAPARRPGGELRRSGNGPGARSQRRVTWTIHQHRKGDTGLRARKAHTSSSG
jgi:hypothetical protein